MVFPVKPGLSVPVLVAKRCISLSSAITPAVPHSQLIVVTPNALDTVIIDRFSGEKVTDSARGITVVFFKLNLSIVTVQIL
ncbi:MAG: hypothetical protein WCF57_15125 [Pyrinomonadaceae bacterium]